MENSIDDAFTQLLPEPFVPADANLRHSIGMAIDPAVYFTDPAYEYETAYAGYMALRLMIASWHQRPAGSLPNDDRALVRLARYGTMRSFQQARAGIMKGWVLCSDGRLYHRAVAEDVMRRLNWKQRPARARSGSRAVTDDEFFR
ncbi:MAG TPA: DUF1376 domain-containing protein [Bradyrhizobium sp.]|nr:DUF1376 domain-containing protein [Bradyrhizobium sp.]